MRGMRQVGGVLVLLGVVGFFYCSGKVADAPPVPKDMGIMESLHEPGGRWDVARYGCALVGATGSVLLVFTRGR
jgi:hypothetical protein